MLNLAVKHFLYFFHIAKKHQYHAFEKTNIIYHYRPKLIA